MTELCAVILAHALAHNPRRKPSPSAACVSLLILNRITLKLTVICGTVKLGVLRLGDMFELLKQFFIGLLTILRLRFA
jgi:hypothetical protein